MQIMLFDMVFSLDSVITAVGMANTLWVMASAIVIAVAIMLVASGLLADFVQRYPTVKMLALSFLMLIGMTLIAADREPDRGVDIPLRDMEAGSVAAIDRRNAASRAAMWPAPTRSQLVQRLDDAQL